MSGTTSFLSAINTENVVRTEPKFTLKKGWVELKAGKPYVKPPEKENIAYKTQRIIKVLTNSHNRYIEEYDSIHGENAYLYEYALGDYMIPNNNE